MEGEAAIDLDNSNGFNSEPNQQYIAELINERQHLDPAFGHAARLLDQEIAQAQTGHEKVKLLELHNDKPTKVVVKVKVPCDEFPKFNFIGKIIGPKGNSLRRIQEETECRMAVFGRGSMRDKEKEEELRKQGGKYAHLNDELHVHVETFGHPIDVYRRLSFAMHELRRHLVPDYNDDVTQQQVQELAILNGTAPPAPKRGRGRGGIAVARGGAQPPPFSVRGAGGPPRARGGRGAPGRGIPFKPAASRPGPQSQAPGYSGPYEQSAGDLESQATGSSQQISEYGQPPSFSDQPAFGSSNSNSGFSSSDNTNYSMTSNTWGGNAGAESGGYGKAPAARTTAGGNRSHPYTQPAGRGFPY